MIVYMPVTAIAQGADERGEVLFPMQALAVVVNEPADATAARFIGHVRGLHEAWRKEVGKP